MPSPPITLAAALRDATLADTRARDLAIRHLADALLAELGPGPRWRAADRHPRGPEVLALLRRAEAGDPSPVIRAFATVGLGQLGDPEAIAPLTRALAGDGDDEASAFRRECAAIGLAQLGAAARGHDDGAPLRHAIRHALEHALASPRPELRFQAAQSLVEVLGDAAEPALADALTRETHPEVRQSLCEALATIEHPQPATCDALRRVLASTGASRATTLAAALALTAAGSADGADALIAALADAEHRDRALEGLAALGALAPASALPPVRRLADAWLVPATTRVRAAYALARLAPAEGLPRLERLARSRRAAVREAVADARRALESLERRTS